ncbi:ubiquitin carboxyl-terminal hydrolase family protein [Cryptosporidium serpentis]
MNITNYLYNDLDHDKILLHIDKLDHSSKYSNEKYEVSPKFPCKISSDDDSFESPISPYSTNSINESETLFKSEKYETLDTEEIKEIYDEDIDNNNTNVGKFNMSKYKDISPVEKLEYNDSNVLLKTELFDLLKSDELNLKILRLKAFKYPNILLQTLFSLPQDRLVRALFDKSNIKDLDIYLPPICVFYSNMFTLQNYDMDMYKGYSLDNFWSFFNELLICIKKLYGLFHIEQVPPIPIRTWILDCWNIHNFPIILESNSQHIKLKLKILRILLFWFLQKNLEDKQVAQIEDMILRFTLLFDAKNCLKGSIIFIFQFLNIISESMNNNNLCLYFERGFQILTYLKNYRIELFRYMLKLLTTKSSLGDGADESTLCGTSQYMNIEKILLNLFIIFHLFGPIFELEYQRILVELATVISTENRPDITGKLVLYLIFSIQDSSCWNLPTLQVLHWILKELMYKIDFEYLTRLCKYAEKLIILFTNGIIPCESPNEAPKCLSILYILLGDLTAYKFASKTQIRKDPHYLAIYKSDYFSHKNTDKEIYTKYIDLNYCKWLYFSSEKVVGIVNIGNTCYMNSVLQCLRFSSLFFYWLYYRKSYNSCLLSKSLYQTIYKMVRPFNNGQPAIFPDRDLIREISTVFPLGVQHDASEFLRFLLSNISSTCPSFNMTTRHFLQCCSCKNTTEQVQNSLSILELSVSRNNCKVLNGLQSSQISLSSILADYFSLEVLDEPKSYHCSKCNCETQARKWSSLEKPCPYLILILNNYTWNTSIKRGVKNKIRIQIEEVFNFQNYCYSIHGLIFHNGNSIDSGHYYCTVRNNNILTLKDIDKESNSYPSNIYPSYSKWYKCDDEFVSIISSDELFHNTSNNPYIIFATYIE